MMVFLEEEPNFGFKESLVVFGFADYLEACFKELSILDDCMIVGP